MFSSKPVTSSWSSSARELFQVGVDEDGDADAGVDQAAGGAAHPLAASDQVEASFGGHLVGPFGNQRHLVRLHPLREPEHRLLGRDLEVEPARDRLPEVDDVLVLNVAAVLAQMHGDAESAGPPRPGAPLPGGSGSRPVEPVAASRRGRR